MFGRPSKPHGSVIVFPLDGFARLAVCGFVLAATACGGETTGSASSSDATIADDVLADALLDDVTPSSEGGAADGSPDAALAADAFDDAVSPGDGSSFDVADDCHRVLTEVPDGNPANDPLGMCCY